MFEAGKLYVPETMRFHTVAGKMHSGKDSAAQITCDIYGTQGLKAEYRSTSSYLKTYATTPEGQRSLSSIGKAELLYEADGKTLTRFGLRELGYVLQNELGGDILVRRMVTTAVDEHRNNGLDVFVLNGIRRIAEAETLRQSGFGLWWVEATLDVRADYAVRSGEVKSKEEFRIKNMPEDMETDIIKSMSTETITNEGSFNDLTTQVYALLNGGKK